MSFGIKVGRGIGALAAYAGEGVVRGAVGLGRFGEDVIEGTEQGYTEKSAALLVSREKRAAAAQARRDAYLAQHALTMAPAAEPVVPAATARKVKA